VSGDLPVSEDPPASGGLLDRLHSAVSPLERGAAPLGVHGWRPRGREAHRPRRTAAVLVAVLQQPDPAVILTVRSSRLARHAGQVAFPGGSADDDDASGVRTALREAQEEIGLSPRRVEPLGFLDRVDTVSDFRVLPVVGLVHGRPRLVPDQREVANVFTVPLLRVLDLGAYRPTRIHHEGVTRVVYHLDWESQHVWGVTASILRNLALRAEGMDPDRDE
jgi:8-oxo-dGTP pyrophosphatase MutT (NUDIX family)